MQLEIPIPPGGANRMWRNFSGRTVMAPKAREWKREVLLIAIQNGAVRPRNDEITVLMTYHPKARKKEAESRLRRLDTDAVIKPVLDALIGIAYLDDYQVVDVRSKLGNPMCEGKIVVEWSPA